MNEAEIRGMFKGNWVFRLYEIKYLSFKTISIVLSSVIFLLGALGAIIAGDPQAYIFNISPYLHLIGIYVVFFSYDWFVKRLIPILIELKDVFDKDAVNQAGEPFEEIIKGPINKIANRNLLMVIPAIIFMALNLMEINAVWNASSPPVLLANWINSPAQSYFKVLYTITHGLIVPFLLGSGVIGLIGYVVLIKKILVLPLRLQKYQKTSLVIELSTGLFMWTLMALGMILLLGRPIVFFKTNINEILLSGYIQAGLALILAVIVGVVPLTAVYFAINNAKKKEIEDWEARLYNLSRLLKECIDVEQKSNVVEHSDREDGHDKISRRISSVEKEIQRINAIPNLPIRWPSILRVVTGSLFSFASLLIKDFVLSRL